MTKKQTNIIIGIIILIVASFAFFFSDDSSELISFGESKSAEAEDVYEKEVIIEPTISTELSWTISPSDAPIIESDSTQIATNTYQVVKVVDGDTLDVVMDGKVERLRLIGIDTPETVDPRKGVQCFGSQASNKAKELLNGQLVALESDESQGERDRYKRLLRYVILPDGTNFNLYMISEGYAHEYTYDQAYKYQTEFKQAEVDARNNSKGLWSPDTCSGDK